MAYKVPGDDLSRGKAFAEEAYRHLSFEYGRSSLPVAQGLAVMIIYEGCLGELPSTIDFYNRLYESQHSLRLDERYHTRLAEAGTREDRVSRALSWINWGFYI
jgi:hypothetical protein